PPRRQEPRTRAGRRPGAARTAWSVPAPRWHCLLGSRLQVSADPPAGRIGADGDSRRTSLGVSWQAATGSGSHAAATSLTTLPGQVRMAKATCAIRAAVAMLGEELDETAGGFLGSFFLDSVPGRDRPSLDVSAQSPR